MHINKTRILAIDPGTKEMGYAYFRNNDLSDYGVKAIRRGKSKDDLFASLDRAVTTLLSEKRPHVLVLEQNYFSQIKQNLGLTLAAGRIKALARRKRVKVIELNPRTIRKIVCANGNATKREVARTISARFPELKPYLESNRRWRERYYQNIFDAIACALAYLKLHDAGER